MPFSEKQLVPPAYEPITLTEIKDQLRIVGTDQDWVLTALITAARIKAERYTRRIFVLQQWSLFIDRFPGSWPFSYGFGSSLLSPYREIHLPKSPLQAINSFQYIDMKTGVLTDVPFLTTAAAMAQTTTQGYQISYAEPPRLQPVYGQAWPVAAWVLDAIQITYTAGYQDMTQSPAIGTAIPEPILLAMRLMIGHWYENRESQEMPPAAYDLLDDFRVWDVAPILNNWERFGR